VLGKPVRLSALDTEKYGRLLAHVHVDGVDGPLSDWMLARGLAVPYDGGRKAEFATGI
jgi:endonuclease YncB( thermonuclease family)